MIAKQLSVFAENKPGKLSAVTSVLAREKVNIRATTIATSDTFGVVNLIVDEPDRAAAALTKAGHLVKLRPVLAVLMEDQPGGLDKLAAILFEAGLNINNAYGFVLENRVKAVFIVDVDPVAEAEKIIEGHGFKTLDAEALAAVEPFHYLRY